MEARFKVGNSQRKSSRIPARRALARALMAVCVIAMVALPLNAQAPDEYQVKAAFLLNFIKFVGWSPSAFENSTAPFRICILGEDPFGRDLDELVAGERIEGHRVEVERLGRGPVPKSCQELFVSKSQKDVAAVLAELGPGVLTVSDREGFLDDGGMIALVVEDRHVRFDINKRAAAKASLTMNARMLNVARSVRQ